MCIEMTSLKANEPSLCIPSTLACVTEETVRRTIEEELCLGEIERIDMTVPREFEHADGVTRKMRRIYIHFKTWDETKVSVDKRLALANGLTELKVVYDAKGHYWKCRGAEYKSEEDLTADKAASASFEFVDSANC